jgi:hypothetical protein
MKTLLIDLFAACACASLHAQTFTWQPSPGHTQVPIWPGAAPQGFCRGMAHSLRC